MITLIILQGFLKDKANMGLHGLKRELPYSPVTHTGIILVGNEVVQLPEDKLLNFASLVSRKLEEYPFTMLQMSKSELVKSMKEGRSVVCLDENTDELLSFSQYWNYKDQHPEWRNSDWQNFIEIGSWVSLVEGHGYGRKVFSAIRSLVTRLEPNRQFVAIVENHNIEAQRIITDVGGFLIGAAISDRIKTQFKKEAFMYVYEIPKGP